MSSIVNDKLFPNFQFRQTTVKKIAIVDLSISLSKDRPCPLDSFTNKTFYLTTNKIKSTKKCIGKPFKKKISISLFFRLLSIINETNVFGQVKNDFELLITIHKIDRGSFDRNSFDRNCVFSVDRKFHNQLINFF